MNFINKKISSMYDLQSTLKSKIFFNGVGIHSGKAVKMSIEPAAPNTGIIFERVDIENNNQIKAVIDNVQISSLCTKIANKHGASVSTIEHLMATFNGLGIDNVRIKLNSPELPAMDGSANDYTNKIIHSGIIKQSHNKKYLKILKKVTFRENERYISITPANKLKMDVEINYPNTVVGNDRFTYTHSQEGFVTNICKARTFAFSDDIEKMRASGLATGGSLQNAIVVDKFTILNTSGLRLDKEFTKHKALDCLGDFYLLGMPLLGRIECFAPGHRLNQNFIKEIMIDRTNYKIEKQFNENVTEDFYKLLNNEKSSVNEYNLA